MPNYAISISDSQNNAVRVEATDTVYADFIVKDLKQAAIECYVSMIDQIWKEARDEVSSADDQ